MSEWISVEDRLPGDKELVVAAQLYGYVSPDAAICLFQNGIFHVYDESLEAENYDGGASIRLSFEISHWCPLPPETAEA